MELESLNLLEKTCRDSGSLGHWKSMLPKIYTLPGLSTGNLSVMARPTAGEWIEDEFTGFRKLGVNCIVSLLEQAEEKELGLSAESVLCAQNEIEFLSFSIPDRGIPDTQRAMALASLLVDKIKQNKHVAIHCRAGIGRTGIVASAVLVKLGLNPIEAINKISIARGVDIPDTEEQKEWVLSLANTT